MTTALPATRRAALLDMADQLDGSQQYTRDSSLTSAWLREVAVILRSRAQDYPEVEEQTGEPQAPGIQALEDLKVKIRDQFAPAEPDPLAVRGHALHSAGLLWAEIGGRTDVETLLSQARAFEAYLTREPAAEEAARLRGLLEEAVDGWSDADARSHLGPGVYDPNPRINQIHREANLP